MDYDSKRTAFTNADGSEAGFDLLTAAEPLMDARLRKRCRGSRKTLTAYSCTHGCTPGESS
jgi:hypothetical protein